MTHTQGPRCGGSSVGGAICAGARTDPQVGLCDPVRWNIWNTVQGQIPGTVTVARTKCRSAAQGVTRRGQSVTRSRASVTLDCKSVTVAAPEVSLYAGASVTRKGARVGWIEGGVKGDHALDCSAGRQCRTACRWVWSALCSRGPFGGWQSLGSWIRPRPPILRVKVTQPRRGRFAKDRNGLERHRPTLTRDFGTGSLLGQKMPYAKIGRNSLISLHFTCGRRCVRCAPQGFPIARTDPVMKPGRSIT